MPPFLGAFWARRSLMVGGNTADLCSPTESSRKAGDLACVGIGQRRGLAQKKGKAFQWGEKGPLRGKAPDKPIFCAPMDRAIPHGARDRNRPSKDGGSQEAEPDQPWDSRTLLFGKALHTHILGSADVEGMLQEVQHNGNQPFWLNQAPATLHLEPFLHSGNGHTGDLRGHCFVCLDSDFRGHLSPG